MCELTVDQTKKLLEKLDTLSSDFETLTKDMDLSMRNRKNLVVAMWVNIGFLRGALTPMAPMEDE